MRSSRIRRTVGGTIAAAAVLGGLAVGSGAAMADPHHPGPAHHQPQHHRVAPAAPFRPAPPEYREPHRRQHPDRWVGPFGAPTFGS
ncbi:hypothetical protein [Gordonia soli]|uniref:hypothetical protein n=1 Tax=Gordonia soli TaxID=320799 RepID=UPI000346AA65|nr:hypothetical protein [Gordonia soli]